MKIRYLPANDCFPGYGIVDYLGQLYTHAEADPAVRAHWYWRLGDVDIWEGPYED